MVTTAEKQEERRRELTPYEQETIINFNREEKTASIFTYEKTWQRHLEGKLGLKPVKDNGFGGREYIIPKDRIPMPRAKRVLSLELTARLTERLKKAHKKAQPALL